MKRIYWIASGIVAYLFALALAFNSPYYWIMLGDFQSRRQEWALALHSYEQAGRQDPGLWRCYTRAAMVYGKLGKSAEEESAYSRGLALLECSETLLPWAEACLSHERFDQARSLLRQAISRGFSPLESRFMMGRMYLQQGQNDKASFWFAKVVEINPNCSFGLAGLAYVAQQEGDLAKAAPLFKASATAATELNQEVLVNAADCYAKTGKAEQAISCLEQASSYSPQGVWPPALLLEARLCKERFPQKLTEVLARLQAAQLSPEQRKELGSLLDH